MVFPAGTHLTAEPTEAMQIKNLAHEHSILMLPGFKPFMSVTRNWHHSHMTNMLQNSSGKEFAILSQMKK